MKLLAALVAFLLGLAAPAGAVVGGKKVSARDTPWFATLSGCGGTLIAPDRIVTAGHCVLAISPAELRGIRVGGVKRNGVRFAMHPDWQRSNGDNVLDDVAIIQLDQPVPNVAPAALGGEAPKRATVLGRGASRPNQTGFGVLREATLKTVSDAACKRIYRRARGNGGERFNGARMICSTDVNGRPPLSSACVGDSGGPLYTGTKQQPVLVGIVSFGGARCGADRLPSVFTQVARYTGFILNPAPVWAPLAAAAPSITGTSKLTCAPPVFDPPAQSTQTLWFRGGRVVGRGRTYRVRKRDRGRTLTCFVAGRGAGGLSIAPKATVSV
jgi:hypothetical protein